MLTTLVISRHFPPLSSAGASIRLVKLIKYAFPIGWNFVVFTQHPDQPVVSELHLSDFLENEIPESTTIIRVPAPFLGRFNHAKGIRKMSLSDRLFDQLNRLATRVLPGTSIWWGLRTFWQSLRYMRKSQVDIIYAVAPVNTNAFIGGLLSQVTKKPLFLDFKDDWVGSPTFLKKPSWRRRVEKSVEQWLVKSSKGVILVTESSYRLYLERYQDLHQPEKFHFIPNGCDLDEFLSLRGVLQPIRSDFFTILSAAWGYQKDYRDITPFLLAFTRFLSKYEADRQLKRVIFLGNSLSREYDDLICQLGIGENIIVIGPVVREELVKWFWQADLFLLVQPVGNTTAISGTLYEYWATGKAPILLIAEEGASSDLIENHNLGRSFRFNEIEHIANYITEIYQCYRENVPVQISFDGVEAYDRKNLANKMTQIWQNSLPEVLPPHR